MLSKRSIILSLLSLSLLITISCVMSLRPEWLRSCVELVHRYSQSHRDQPILVISIFWVFCLISSSLGIPASLPALLAGFVYRNVWLGAIAVEGGVFLSASAHFGFFRLLSSPHLKQPLTRVHDTEERESTVSSRSTTSASKYVETLKCAIEKESFKISLLLRLLQILPFTLTNYLLSQTPISYGLFVVSTVLGTLPGLTFFVYIGTLLQELSEITNGGDSGDTGKKHQRQYALMVCVVLVSMVYALAGLGVIARRSWRATLLRLKQSNQLRQAETNEDYETVGSDEERQSLDNSSCRTAIINVVNDADGEDCTEIPISNDEEEPLLWGELSINKEMESQEQLVTRVTRKEWMFLLITFLSGLISLAVAIPLILHFIPD